MNDGFTLAPPNHTPVARMRSKDARFEKTARGHLNITTLLSQGWAVIPHPVNRLLPEYLPAELKQSAGAQLSNGEKGAVVGLDPVKTETKNTMEVQQKRGPGRPRKPR